MAKESYPALKAWRERWYAQRCVEYEAVPKRCLRCQNVIPFSKRRNNFCSQICANKRVAPPQRTCICGKDLKSYAERYCSRSCAGEARYLAFIEKWKAGEVEARESGLTPTRIKRYFIETYGAKCTKCGWAEAHPVSGNVPVQLHHKDGDASNIREENMELLCPNCHALTPNFGARNRGKGRSWRREQYRRLAGAQVSRAEYSVNRSSNLRLCSNFYGFRRLTAQGERLWNALSQFDPERNPQVFHAPILAILLQVHRPSEY